MQVIHPAIRALGYRAVFGLAYCQCLTRGMLAHHLTSRTNNLIIVNTNYYHLVYYYYKQMSNKFLTITHCLWLVTATCQYPSCIQGITPGNHPRGFVSGGNKVRIGPETRDHGKPVANIDERHAFTQPGRRPGFLKQLF